MKRQLRGNLFLAGMILLAILSVAYWVYMARTEPSPYCDQWCEDHTDAPETI